jgi:hypothetical protein
VGEREASGGWERSRHLSGRWAEEGSPPACLLGPDSRLRPRRHDVTVAGVRPPSRARPLFEGVPSSSCPAQRCQGMRQPADVEKPFLSSNRATSADSRLASSRTCRAMRSSRAGPADRRRNRSYGWRAPFSAEQAQRGRSSGAGGSSLQRRRRATCRFADLPRGEGRGSRRCGRYEGGAPGRGTQSDQVGLASS